MKKTSLFRAFVIIQLMALAGCSNFSFGSQDLAGAAAAAIQPAAQADTFQVQPAQLETGTTQTDKCYLLVWRYAKISDGAGIIISYPQETRCTPDYAGPDIPPFMA